MTLCSPGVGKSIGSTIYTQLKSTVYEVLTSVNSLGQGEWAQCPGWLPLRGRPHPRSALDFSPRLSKPDP